MTVLLVGAFVGRYWYDARAESNPELGVSFACRQARYLGEDCLPAFRSVLDDLGARHIRLSLYWSDVEVRPGVYDFSETDALVREASSRGADVLLTVGIKAQRYPEVYVPSWLLEGRQLPVGTALDSAPGVRDAALRFDAAAIDHFRSERAITAWQVENEPFIKNFEKINGWTVSEAMTASEVALVRAHDTSHRLIVVTHSSWTVYDQAWKRALGLGDVLGQNLFTKKAWIRDWWYFFPYAMGPFVPNLPGQAAASRAQHKQFWITELQAEPEERRSLTALRPDEVKSISPRLLSENAQLARRSGASRVYLWGAEWWYATRGRSGGGDLWEPAKRIFARH